MIELDADLLSGGLWVTPKLWNSNLNKLSVCTMLFDTGAAMTTIDMSIANRSGIQLSDTKAITVHGVGGTVSGYLTTIREFWLGDVNIGTISVHVIPFNENSEVQAVLGMNVIKEFRVTIDLKYKTEDSDGTIIMEPTFDLNAITHSSGFTPEHSRFGIWSAIHRSSV